MKQTSPALAVGENTDSALPLASDAQILSRAAQLRQKPASQHNETGRTVLQKRDNEPWTWVRTEGKGRVFYTAYGHDERTFSNPGFHDLLFRGIVWSVGDEAAARFKKWNPTPLAYDPSKEVRR